MSVDRHLYIGPYVVTGPLTRSLEFAEEKLRQRLMPVQIEDKVYWYPNVRWSTKTPSGVFGRVDKHETFAWSIHNSSEGPSVEEFRAFFYDEVTALARAKTEGGAVLDFGVLRWTS